MSRLSHYLSQLPPSMETGSERERSDIRVRPTVRPSEGQRQIPALALPVHSCFPKAASSLGQSI